MLVRTLVVCFTLAFLAPPLAATPQEPTFRARVDGVRIDVLATSGGRPITGLQADDFELRDDGVVQQITVVPRNELPISVILALDASDSVKGARLEALQSAARALLAVVQAKDEAALLTFSKSVVERAPLTTDIHRVIDALADIEAADATVLVDATLASILIAERDASRSLVMLLSDGVDTGSFLSPKVVLDAVRFGNAVVYAVWSGRGPRPSFLEDTVDLAAGRLIDIGRSGDLKAAFLEILREFRQRYLITYTPSGVASGGWHRIDVRLKRRIGDLQFRRGYFAAK